ncbi:EamA family transporter [Natroniella sp. ANB-PHB2]|uniref:EamA family transporter n=1 Tax=Natroniella sp. ANB-PHB2 TaxID=3384444 RepID=UPI0038D3A6DC
MLSKSKLGYLYITVAMLIWGSIGVMVNFILYPAELIVFYRVLFAFIFLSIILIKREKFTYELKGNSRFLLIETGVSLALNWIFFFQALKNTTVTIATLSYYTAPIIVSIISMLFLDEDFSFKVLYKLN